MNDVFPATLVRDGGGYWHAMKPVAHRLRALCGYLDLDTAAVTRKDYPSCEMTNPEDVTCDHCFLLMPHAENPKP